jgi:capsid portal protein
VFDANSRSKVRSACGVSPLFTAETQDYTRATAQAALQVAESNTFAPPRRALDTAINRHIMPRIDAKWWLYRGNGPRLTSLEDVGRAADALTKLGAGTPNVGADLVGRALGVEIPGFDQRWADLPFPLVQVLANQGLLDVMAEERLERAVDRVVERVMARAEAGWEPEG